MRIDTFYCFTTEVKVHVILWAVDFERWSGAALRALLELLHTSSVYYRVCTIQSSFKPEVEFTELTHTCACAVSRAIGIRLLLWSSLNPYQWNHAHFHMQLRFITYGLPGVTLHDMSSYSCVICCHRCIVWICELTTTIPWTCKHLCLHLVRFLVFFVSIIVVHWVYNIQVIF